MINGRRKKKKKRSDTQMGLFYLLGLEQLLKWKFRFGATDNNT